MVITSQKSLRPFWDELNGYYEKGDKEVESEDKEKRYHSERRFKGFDRIEDPRSDSSKKRRT